MSDAPYWNLSSPEILSEDENIGVNLTSEGEGLIWLQKGEWLT